MKHITLSLAVISTVFLMGCSSDKDIKAQISKALQEDPTILTKAIEQHPAEFITALQNAAKNAQESMAKVKEDEEKKQLEESFSKPLIAEIRSDEAIRGPKDAVLTLVEYSDFECPFCSRGNETVEKLMKKYEGKIRFVYKHLPLSFHEKAMISAQYFEAIRIQNSDKAFAFHDEIFKNQSKLKEGTAFLDSAAKKAGADMVKLKKDLNSDAVKNRIAADVAEAGKFGMSGTPGFLINGVPVRGAYPAEYFVSLIEELQKRGQVKI